MKIIITLLLSILSIISYSQCGTERWDIKTAKDAAALKIDTLHIISTTPGKLADIKSPKWSRNLNRQPLEMRVVKIYCYITFYKSEADQDIHLVLKDTSTGQTIIGEIPSASCSAGSLFYKSIYKSKESFKKYVISSNTLKPGVYEITGVIFFDKVHGQIGVAKNGIELHPILSIRLVN